MATQLNAVCVALTTLWDAAPALDGVNVVDGPQANADPSAEWLFVGFDGAEPDEGNEGATTEQDFMAFAKTKQEVGEVVCAVVVVSGAVDIPAVRSRALAILSAAEDALRADVTVGGLVMKAYVSAHRYHPVVTTAASKARVVFTITYQAQI